MLAVKARDALPIDIDHKGVDISCRLGAVVDLIWVLVRIESENRTSPSETAGVISGPLIHELFVSMRISQ